MIRWQHVRVKYANQVSALDEVNLEVNRGEFVYFVGPTGSGKSTLLKTLTREVAHTGGTVHLNGRELGDLRPRHIPGLRREMGIVAQDYALLPNKKVWENLAYAMRAVGRSRREVRKLVPEILETVGLVHRNDAFPSELSGGEQQRVAIARALINRPPLLIADEPTGNLDPDRSLEIVRLLSQLNEEGMTVLVATHDVVVVKEIPHRTVLLRDGKVIDQRGGPDA
jgi:cell division transport system ATP-binding protein